MGSAKDLTEGFSGLMMFESTQAPTTTRFNLIPDSNSFLGSNSGSPRDGPSSFPIGLQNAASTVQEINLSVFQDFFRKLGRLPTRLNNVVRTYQDLLREIAGLVRRLRLTRAQEGLILTITSQDCLVHWPGTFSQSSDTRLVDKVVTLSYQEGSTFCDADALTEAISDSNRAGVE
jgi:hypothetical protein